MDFGDVKTRFDPLFKALDHHPLYEIADLPDGDVASIATWCCNTAAVLPEIDRWTCTKPAAAGHREPCGLRRTDPRLICNSDLPRNRFSRCSRRGAPGGPRGGVLPLCGLQSLERARAGPATAVCQFCDTDFIGTDGVGGGKFATADDLAAAIAAQWPGGGKPYVVCTGGEPLLQLDGP